MKAAGQTLHEKLDALYWQYGCHAERQVSVTMPGSEGMAQMAVAHGPASAAIRRETLAGLKVEARARLPGPDASSSPGASRQRFPGPKGDMVMLDLAAEGTYVAVRPSGTEPKVKFYMFAYEPAEQIHDLAAVKGQLSTRLDALAQDLATFSRTA